MAYKVIIKQPALRVLQGLSKDLRTRILHRIDALAVEPRPFGCTKLSGALHAYRIRIGNYRVVDDVLDKAVVVIVLRVAHRKDIYR